MREVIIWDTEYWTDEGMQDRHWRGLDDSAPFVVQIGALKVKLEDGLPIEDEFLCYVKPLGYDGKPVKITPFFTELTHITQETVDNEGVDFPIALKQFQEFVGNLRMYSYGNDIYRPLIESCYLTDTVCPFPHDQAFDARHLFRKSPMISDNDIYTNNSGTMAQHVGAYMPETHFAHDARNDCFSMVQALRYLIDQGGFSLNDF